MTGHTLYVILNYVSVFVMLLSCGAIAMRSESRMQKLALMVCMSLTVCCIGFLFRAEATSADTFIAGQKMVYTFVTHGMFIMLLFILDYCNFSVPTFIKNIFHCLNLFISVSVLTLDHHKLFYKSYHAIDLGGYCELEKEYGPIHTLAVGLFGLYMAATLVVSVIFTVKHVRKRTRYVWYMLIAVLIPCVSYIIPKLTDSNNDLQPMAFALFMLLVQIMIFRNKLYDVDGITEKFSLASGKEGIIVFDRSEQIKGWNNTAAELFPFLKDVELDSRARAVSPVLGEILDGKMTEHKTGDKIYGITVDAVPDDAGNRTIGRVIRIEDITTERNYTDLLQEQKKLLEQQVSLLSDYSYKDNLTGMLNRRAYEEDIEQIRQSGSVADTTIVSFDLNGLKQTNDSLGHAAGDDLIKTAAEAIQNVFSGSGKCYRTGGDEFVAILSGHAEEMPIITEQFKAEVKKNGSTVKNGLSISFGAVSGRDHPDSTVDELLIAADQAMYLSKKQYYEQAGVDRRHR